MHHIESVEIKSAIVSSKFNQSADHGDVTSKWGEVKSSEALFCGFFIHPAFDIVRIFNPTEHRFQ